MISYTTWVYKYRKYLIELRKIFAQHILEIYPEYKDFIFSDKFFSDFCNFVYNSSSKKVSHFL